MIRKKRFWPILLLALFAILLQIGNAMSKKRLERLSLESTAHQLCDSKPNCVCSLCESGKASHIQPLNVSQPRETLLKLLQAQPRVRIITKEDSYIHAEFRTLICRYVDDVEFLIDPTSETVHVRSASRLGHSDLGANRKRVERLRQLLAG